MNWKIKQIKTLNSPKIGTIVNASFSISDGKSTIDSDTDLLPANTDSFIDLQSVTENQIIQWVKDSLNSNSSEDNISEVERLEALVTIKTNTIQSETTALPWL